MKKFEIIKAIEQMASKEKLPIEILQSHTTWFDSLKEEGNPADFIFTCFQSEDPSSAESENNLTVAVSLNTGRAAHYRTAVADDDFELLEEYPAFKNEVELLELLKQKSKEFLRAVNSAEDEEDEGSDSSDYQEVKCPVCDAWLCDEEGNAGECPHLLMFWNTDCGPEFIKTELKDLLTDEFDIMEIEENEKYNEIKRRVGSDVELIESKTGLNPCLTSVGTIYILVKLE